MRGEVDEETRKREPQSKCGQTWESHGVRLKHNFLYQQNMLGVPYHKEEGFIVSIQLM